MQIPNHTPELKSAIAKMRRARQLDDPERIQAARQAIDRAVAASRRQRAMDLLREAEELEREAAGS